MENKKSLNNKITVEKKNLIDNTWIMHYNILMNHKKNMRKERCYPLKKKKRKKDEVMIKTLLNGLTLT